MFVNEHTNPALALPLLHQNPENTGSRSAIGSGFVSGMSIALVIVCFLALCPVTLQAQSHKSKVPIVGKLGSTDSRQAYSGKVQSLDLKQRILNVNSLHGRESEIFPFKKNVRIESLNGDRMNLKALKPGTTVLIYFNQKSGERKIRNIVVLSSTKEQAKGKRAPSS